MTKPESFGALPGCLQERLLWECSLRYDAFESSKAEAVHDILCNYPHNGSTNDLIIKSAYKNLSIETLERWTKQELESCEALITALNNLLTNPKP